MIAVTFFLDVCMYNMDIVKMKILGESCLANSGRGQPMYRVVQKNTG